LKLKQLILTALVAVFMFTALTPAGFGQTMAENQSVWMFGLRYDKEVVGTFGGGVRLTGNLWEFVSGDFGEDKTINTETVYLLDIPGSFLSIGPILGPNLQWQNETGDGKPPIAYIVGATGFAGAFQFGQGYGGWFYHKKRFSLDKESDFEGGWVTAFGIYVPI